MSMPKCVRCNTRIDPKKSAFYVRLTKESASIFARVAKASEIKSHEVSIHVNGDRECRKEVAGYRKTLLEALEMPNDYDISYLDNY